MDNVCASCGYEAKEHSYNGACYGICGKFVERTWEPAVNETLRYAHRLATSLWEKHWKADAPYWQVQPDLIGTLTQIDNMCAGLVRLPDHLPQIPDSDADFTPDLARKIIARYQALLQATPIPRSGIRAGDKDRLSRSMAPAHIPDGIHQFKADPRSPRFCVVCGHTEPDLTHHSKASRAPVGTPSVDK